MLKINTTNINAKSLSQGQYELTNSALVPPEMCMVPEVFWIQGFSSPKNDEAEVANGLNNATENGPISGAIKGHCVPPKDGSLCSPSQEIATSVESPLTEELKTQNMTPKFLSLPTTKNSDSVQPPNVCANQETSNSNYSNQVEASGAPTEDDPVEHTSSQAQYGRSNSQVAPKATTTDEDKRIVSAISGDGVRLIDVARNFRASRFNLEELKHSDLVHLQTLLEPRLTKYIPHTPTPKQAAFLLLDCKEAFYGGSAGGGKSDALLMAGLQYVDVKGYAGILFRKTYADLTKPGALIERAKDWLFRFDDCKWNDKDKRFEFFEKYGGHKETISILQFGYLESENDKYNYQGGEYQFIGFDELTHISQASYEYMFSRLRKLRGSPVPLRVRGASNPPDDDSGIWVKTRFIDEGILKGRIFIPAGLDDNPYLDKEQYEESLAELDPVTRARLRDGDWQIVRKGNMFKRQWFQAVTELPQFRRRVRYWDMAATDEARSKRKNKSGEADYTVGLLLSEADGVFYIEDIIRERKSPAGTNELQKITASLDGRATLVREEREPGSSGIYTIDSKRDSLFVGYDYDGVYSTGSKVQRAAAASSLAEKGKIKVLSGCRNIEAFYNEAESFPGGIHDDIVDALSGAISVLGILTPYMMPIGIGDNYDDIQSKWADEASLAPGYFGRFGF